MSDKIQKIVTGINNGFYGPHDFVPTCGGRGEHHLHGYVGHLWRKDNPEIVKSLNEKRG